MKDIKSLNNEIGIKNIKKPKDLEPLEDISTNTYSDPKYPYDSKWVGTETNKKIFFKKTVKKQNIFIRILSFFKK